MLRGFCHLLIHATIDLVSHLCLSLVCLPHSPSYLGGHDFVVEFLGYKLPVPWPQPLCCLGSVRPTSGFLVSLKYGTLQYTLLTPLLALVAIILELFHQYGDGVIDWHKGYVYVMLLQNTSQLTALYCLVWLYMALKNELAPFSPMAKFLVVKSVVFFTFWQMVTIACMIKLGWITDGQGLTAGGSLRFFLPSWFRSSWAHHSAPSIELGVFIQDALVCFEMFLAATAHKYTFGYVSSASPPLSANSYTSPFAVGHVRFRCDETAHGSTCSFLSETCV